MQIQDLNGKKICILGFGREGQSVARALETYAPNCSLTIADSNENINAENYQLSTINYQLGEAYLQNLDQFDIIIKSPGIPPCAELAAVQKSVTNATQIFMDTVSEKGSTIIGVTGSKGKSTTSSLLGAILKKAGKDTYVVGNIGIPVLDFIDHAKEDTIFVQELSSYQLMNVTSSPSIAVVTSFFPDHLDYHGSLDAYLNAKKQIARFQQKTDHIFYAVDTPGAKEIGEISPGYKHPYSHLDAPITIEDTNLIGEHNLRNIAGAWLVAEHLGVPEPVAAEAIQHFSGLPHRLENLGEHHGSIWIDDAISTTPESTIAALRAISDVQTLICGGQDRGYDFTELGKEIDVSSIQNVILFPDSGVKIRSTISKNVDFYEVDNMEKAVEVAMQQNRNSVDGNRKPIVLLSTASPSYNMFKNFEEKGDEFKQCIGELKEKR